VYQIEIQVQKSLSLLPFGRGPRTLVALEMESAFDASHVPSQPVRTGVTSYTFELPRGLRSLYGNVRGIDYLVTR
jgi:hypothetical protein